MRHVFQQHYTLDEARAELPQMRAWFDEIDDLTTRVREADEELRPQLASGADLGGRLVSRQIHHMNRVQSILKEFHRRQIQVKDLQRGLIDFPAILDDREVLLCWERSEEDITCWHTLESGFAGRQPLWVD